MVFRFLTSGVSQRRARKRQQLPSHMIEALDAIGFPWRVRRMANREGREKDSSVWMQVSLHICLSRLQR